MDGIADLREDYQFGGLTEEAAGSDPFRLFATWFDQAKAAGLREPNAMALATADANGSPSVRIVLLKGVDSGFLFFTNRDSRKGRELKVNPRAALCFHWIELERQVRITGRVEEVSRDVTNTYFEGRPRGSRIGAWSSPQSRPIPGRDAMERDYAEVAAKFGDGPIPAPAFWGGYRVIPDAIEFWQGRSSRMHDRLLFQKAGEGWTRQRLAP